MLDSNGLSTVISVIIMVFTAGAAWYTGKRGYRDGSLTEATQTVQLLRAEIETLKSRLQDREKELEELRGRLRQMEDLVTQRADVDGVRQVVDRIAEKVGADVRP